MALMPVGSVGILIMVSVIGIGISAVSSNMRGEFSQPKGVFPAVGCFIYKLCKMKRKLSAVKRKCDSGNQMNHSEWCSVNSYRGWTDHCDSFRLCQKYYEPVKPYALNYYETVVKPKERKAA